MSLRKISFMQWAIAGAVGVTLSVLVIYFGEYGASNGGSTIGPSTAPVQELESIKPLEPEMSAWLVEWHWKDGLNDAKGMLKGLTSLHLFAAYFDDSDRLLFSEAYREGFPQAQEQIKDSSSADIYLTIVNDRVHPDWTSDLKDPQLVSRLVATSASRQRHIEDILTEVERLGTDGVELDYENVAEGDWERLGLLFSELYAELNKRGLKMKVVLEPRAPIEKIQLPEGPDYVMMAYNLFGYHSGPGPKADAALIGKLTKRMEQVPGERNVIALATGGFDWAETGEIVSLTEVQAVEQFREAKSPLKRDEASGSVYYTYVDQNGVEHTVWYADSETLSRWMQYALDAGYPRIAIWRLGGFSEETIDMLNQV